MSELSFTEINELMECLKCGQQVDQVLAMQCEHNLCLLCASKIIIKQSRQQLVCEFCSTATQLDPSAFQFLQQQSNPQLFASLQNPLDHQDTKLSFHNPPAKQQYFVTVCPQHSGEDALLYCATCDCQCFCMECYLNGQHKTHEVRNVLKFYPMIKQTKVDQLQGSIKAQQDALFNEQCKLTSRKQDQLELLSIVKLQIQSQFDQLYMCLKKKENELLKQADLIISERIEQYDREASRLKQQLEVADHYQSEMASYFPLEDVPNGFQIEALNYLAKNQKKLKQFANAAQVGNLEGPGQLWFEVGVMQRLADEVESIGLQQQQAERSLCDSVKKVQDKENAVNHSFLERSSNKKNRCMSNSYEQVDFDKRFKLSKYNHKTFL